MGKQSKEIPAKPAIRSEKEKRNIYKPHVDENYPQASYPDVYDNPPRPRPGNIGPKRTKDIELPDEPSIGIHLEIKPRKRSVGNY
jgi:hypothetical protein